MERLRKRIDIDRSNKRPPDAILTPSPHTSLVEALSRFAPIGLDEIRDAALLQRVTTKMVLREDQLIEAVGELSDSYRILEIDGRRLHRYQTQYFDTPGYALYRQHHNGQRPRYKVRIRAYKDAGVAFLEVKRKSNRNVTLKKRFQIPAIATDIGPRSRDFLASTLPFPMDWLEPTLWNQFRRATLVSTHRAERVTLDTGLSLRLGEREIALPGLAIVEMKRPDHTWHSEFMAQLRAFGVRPISFSKYCLGISLLAPHVKTNRFKPQHLLLDQIIQ